MSEGMNRRLAPAGGAVHPDQNVEQGLPRCLTATATGVPDRVRCGPDGLQRTRLIRRR